MNVITRIWHGVTRREHADEYLRYLVETAVPEYKFTAGNISTKILRRYDGDVCHFWTMTEWDSLESIKKFAGDDVEKAKYYPKDAEFLIETEPRVVHCETFEF